MRLIYCDESGISNLKHEPHVVVASVMVHGDDQLNPLEKHLHNLVDNFIPERHSQNFVFHAMELFGGGGPVFTRPKPGEQNPEWPLEKRLEIARALARIPADFNLPIVFGWIDRASFSHEMGFPPEAPDRSHTAMAHAGAFMQCSGFVERWMRQFAPTENCLMIVEDNDNARRVIRDTQKAYQSQDVKLIGDELRKYFPLTRIKEDPLFLQKRKGSPLQLADFCAYVFKRMLMNDRHYKSYGDAFAKQVVCWPP